MIGDFGLKECILKEKNKNLTSGSNVSSRKFIMLYEIWEMHLSPPGTLLV
jgi:hypothetical protein